MKIVHIIDGLTMGGAENLLLGVVDQFAHHENYIVLLQPKIEFSQERLQNAQIISLDCLSTLGLIRAAVKCRRVVNGIKPDIIHVHLPFSSAVVRLSGLNRKYPVFFSVHNHYSGSLKGKSRILYFCEKYMSSKYDRWIFVSESAREDYRSIARIKGESHVLHNYIHEAFFDEKNHRPVESRGSNIRKLISVGNLKSQKNYARLIEAVASVESLTLDIFGEGGDRESLEKLIASVAPGRIRLMGSTGNIPDLLKNYDAFVLASAYEGFGIAPLEAAAAGLPVILSNIPVFLEITGGHAVFVDPLSVSDIRQVLERLAAEPGEAWEKATLLQASIKSRFRVDSYCEALMQLYLQAVADHAKS